MYQDVTFAIAAAGTVSGAVVIPSGYRLQSLNVPAIDSASLTLTLSDDGSTFRATYDASGASGVLQAASTGDRIVTLAESLSRATEGRSAQLTAGAAQSGGARTIVGRCVRTDA